MSDQVHATGPMYRPSHDDQAIDPGMRRVLYLMAAGGLVVLAGIGVYSLFGHSGGGAVPVIQADAGPMRVKPVDPGGMVVTPEAKAIDPNESHLAPGTEEPDPRALLALTTPVKGPAVPPAMMPAHNKPVTVQLSQAKSETQARLDWDRLAKRMPELFASHRALFQKTDEHGAAPWLLRTGGFSDTAQARAFCDKVKAKGGQCTLVES